MQEPSVSDPVFRLTSGPVDAYPAVLRALSRTVLYDYDPAFLACYERVNEKAREALRTAMPPVILQGEPVLGLEAAAASLIARDDVVLNLASGVYGKGFGYWAKRYCAELVEIETAYNEAIDPAEVAAAFDKRPDIKSSRSAITTRPRARSTRSTRSDGSSPRAAATSSSMRCRHSAAWTCIRTHAGPIFSSPAPTNALAAPPVSR
jgi:hypothetical protein